MSTREFIRKLRRWARQRGIRFKVKKYESKGSHRRLYVGAKNTTIPCTNDLKTGVVHGILKQLEIDDFF